MTTSLFAPSCYASLYKQGFDPAKIIIQDIDKPSPMYLALGVSGVFQPTLLSVVDSVDQNGSVVKYQVEFDQHKMFPNLSISLGVKFLDIAHLELEFSKPLIPKYELTSNHKHQEIQVFEQGIKGDKSSPRSWRIDRNFLSDDDKKNSVNQTELQRSRDRQNSKLFTKVVPKYTASMKLDSNLIQFKLYADILKFNKLYNLYAGSGFGIVNLRGTINAEYKANSKTDSSNTPHDNDEFDKYSLRFKQNNLAYCAIVGLGCDVEYMSIAIELGYQNLGKLKQKLILGDKYEDDKRIININQNFQNYSTALRLVLNF